jgi:hypothetical protein
VVFCKTNTLGVFENFPLIMNQYLTIDEKMAIHGAYGSVPTLILPQNDGAKFSVTGQVIDSLTSETNTLCYLLCGFGSKSQLSCL